MCMSTGVKSAVNSSRNTCHRVMPHNELGGTEGGRAQMCMSTGVKSAVDNSRKTFHRVMSHHEVNRMDALRNYFNEAFGLIACCILFSWARQLVDGRMRNLHSGRLVALTVALTVALKLCGFCNSGT